MIFFEKDHNSGKATPAKHKISGRGTSIKYRDQGRQLTQHPSEINIKTEKAKLKFTCSWKKSGMILIVSKWTVCPISSRILVKPCHYYYYYPSNPIENEILTQKRRVHFSHAL